MYVLSRFLILSTGLSLGLCACGTVVPSTPLNPTTASAVRSPLPTTVPSAHPIQTPRSLSEPTQALIPVASLMPSAIPTLSVSESDALLLHLSLNNQRCQLPCWWGIQPGQTSWTATARFLSTFALAIKPDDGAESVLHTAYFRYPREIDPNATESSTIAIAHHYMVVDNVITRIEVNPGLIPSYTLAGILGVYGVPEEIRLRTYSQSREGDLQFDVVLFYPDSGMLIRYATQGTIVANQVMGCPQEQPASVLALWAPEPGLAFSDAVRRTINIRDEQDWVYRPLQEVANMSIDTFSKTYQEIDATACLETSRNLWPVP